MRPVAAAKYSNSFSPVIPIRKWNWNPLLTFLSSLSGMKIDSLDTRPHPFRLVNGTGILTRSLNRVPAFYSNERDIVRASESSVDLDSVNLNKQRYHFLESFETDNSILFRWFGWFAERKRRFSVRRNTQFPDIDRTGPRWPYGHRLTWRCTCHLHARPIPLLRRISLMEGCWIMSRL